MPTPALKSRAAVASQITEIRRMLEGMEDAEQIVRERETCTRYAIIDPILWALGWETWNTREVRVEYQGKRNSSARVDYALLGQDGFPVILIEAKTWGKPLDKWVRQIGSYARGMGEGMACITDGWEWVIYDLSQRGRFTSKRVASVDIWADENRRAAITLNKWLRKSLWW